MQTLRNYLTAVYAPSKLDLKPSSARQLRISLSALDKWAGKDVRLEELSTEMITLFLRSQINAKLSPRTVNNRRAAIITVWSHAKRRGQAAAFDPGDIPRCKLPKRAPTAWTREEMVAIVANLKRPWLIALVRFLYETGSRFSAATLLTWENWSPQHRLMQLPVETAKTGVEQFVRVTQPTADAIEALRGSSPRIFPCPNDRRPIWAELKAACKSAGLPHTRRDLFQKIRRTTATLTAVATSVDLASRQLGHTSTRMTMDHYIDPRFLPSVQASDVLPPL